MYINSHFLSGLITQCLVNAILHGSFDHNLWALVPINRDLLKAMEKFFDKGGKWAAKVAKGGADLGRMTVCYPSISSRCN
jgi:hypothetical protein